MFTKNKKDKNTYHRKPKNIKYLSEVRIIALKSLRKYLSEKHSHHVEISQSIYNVNETCRLCMIGALSRKALPKKL